MTKQKFDEFVLAHGRDILWFCRMTAGNAHEGDELYQDTMLTLLEHLDRLDEKNNSK
ncbi:MAG: sigma-70 family RNA polymerase sigma factor, partial [Agathobacter sp.]|nr:sigma-70 family RNA polymerase sigma factor [Agathobacter sp.]